jgi:hypothetical protein
MLGIVLAGWQIAEGLRSGKISAVGQVYATAERSKQPVRFWFFLAFNLILIVAGLLLLSRGLRP